LFFIGTVVTAIVAAIINAWVVGQPLSGLVKLQGLYKTFFLSPVPAWAFALVLMVAVFSFIYAVKNAPSRKRKGRVHFIPDGFNTGWAKQHDKEMNARIGGTFTYDGPDKVIVLQAFLKGAAPAGFGANIEPIDGSGKTVATEELWLAPGHPVRGVLYLRFGLVLGTPGQPLRREVFFRDSFGRDFSVGQVDFPYIGSR
jgi:hypothetical protein